MSSESERPLSSSLVLLMAIGCGAAVANIYYAQPLLAAIARSFSISHGSASLIVTATQVGYALGLAWLFTVLAVRARRASVRAT